jgi:uncharacterized protein with HEPN domain
MSRRDPVLSLEDMHDAIVTIEEYVKGLTFDQYITEKKTKDAVIRNFELPGEAATHRSKGASTTPGALTEYPRCSATEMSSYN